MKKILFKIQDSDKLEIEDTMWLFKEKEQIQNV